MDALVLQPRATQAAITQLERAARLLKSERRESSSENDAVKRLHAV